VNVSASAPSAAADDNLLSVCGNIADIFAGFVIENERTHGDFDDAVLAVFAMHFVFASGDAIFGMPETSVAQVAECGETVVAFEDDITTATAVAAVWSTLRNVHFAAKSCSAIAAFPGGCFNFNFIDESHLFLALA
jgi:hypothetical protein